MRKITKSIFRLSPKLHKRLGFSYGEKHPSAKPQANYLSQKARAIFEHKKINTLLGGNLAAIAIVTSVLPTSSPIPAQNINIEPMVASEQTITLATQRGAQYPLVPVRVTQGYRFYHPGIDFDGITGDPVYPAMTGTVELIQYSRFGYGNAVIVNHGGGIKTLYAHFSKIHVKKDQKVNMDTVIGEVGSTGRSSGDHLHFEVVENGVKINPYNILPSTSSQIASLK